MRTRIQSLRVALDALFNGSVHEHFHELAGREQFAHHLPFRAERRNERTQHYQARIGHQARHLAHAADILHAVGIGEPQVAVQAVAHVVAVEQVSANAMRMQLLLKQIRDGGLAGTGKTREPHGLRGVSVQALACGTVHRHRLAMHIGGATQGERHHARTHRGVRLPVDEDERTSGREVREGIDRYRCSGVEIAEAHFVQVQGASGVMLERVHIHLVLDVRDAHRHRSRAKTHEIRPARQQFFFRHPQHVSGELVGHFRACVGSAQHVATCNVDFIRERQRHGIARLGFRNIAFGSDNARDGRRLAGTRHH